MKKALNLVIMYFVTIVTGVALGTVLYSFYINVINFVAGTEIAFFTAEHMINSLFYVTFCVLIIVCPLISYYRIRHPGGISQVITFIILAAITWVIFIPGLFKLTDNYKNKYYEQEEPIPLSKGYFRKVGDTVYYFTDDFSKNKEGKLETTAVVINLDDEYRNVKFNNFIESEDEPLFSAAWPYRDILLRNTMRNNNFPISVSLRNIVLSARNKVNSGLLPFIGYLSLGLALASVFSLSKVFNWKLLNTLFITLSSVFILMINSRPDLLGINFIEKKLGGSGFINLFSKFGQQPLLVFINFLLAFIFILVGVILFIVRKHSKKS